MKTHLFTLILLCSPAIFAQVNVEEKSVQVKPNLELNKVYNYSFTDQNFSISVNDTISKVVNNSLKSLELIDKNDFANKFEFVNGKNSSNDPDAFYRDFINNSEGIKYQFTTNPAGEFLELLNVSDIENNLLKVTERLGKQKKKSEDYKANITHIEEMVKSKTYVPYIFEQELHVFNFFNGQYFRLGEYYEGKSMQENIFGFPISSTTNTYLKEINLADGSYTIVSDQNLSKDDFEKLWEEMAYYMLHDAKLNLTQEQVKKEIKKYSETVELKVKYENTYDLNSILLKADYLFSLNIGSKKTVNKLTIKRLDD
ncbi:hypothetical protein SAMN05443634_1066 [Chishuiella changwenlii]|uniref:Uncharacterized protein n=1 Tax=Chishuiella changwenlii TaxID=1434701 RepID=A0A1M6XXP4_9FLAO|nr:hypothetical protein [Chishuiella changwenlii]GGE94146.1 hypothetical protein GCM10010984_09760 [Chishuiella changwenlii]SHL10774.1 hypothetical protein SAMN05443634_1066 [Chishuiella changwenlii]